MGRHKTLVGKINKGNVKNKDVGLNITIKDFIKTVGYKGYSGKGEIPFGIYLSLEEISRYIDTLGDLKRLAEHADGFSRLKNGVYFNKEKYLPGSALRNFGKKKLEVLNEILSEHGIRPIPWIARKYRAWEKLKKRSEGGYELHLEI